MSEQNSYLIEVDGVEYDLEVIGSEIVVREFTQDWKNLMDTLRGEEGAAERLTAPPVPLFSLPGIPKLNSLIFRANEYFDTHDETTDPVMDDEITAIAAPYIRDYLRQQVRRRLPKPARVEEWRRLVKSLDQYRDVHQLVPYLLVSTFWRGCKAYYGGAIRALWKLGTEELGSWWRLQVVITIWIWISDTAGWTKVYHYQATDEMIAHSERHGRKCSGSPNCDDPDCISRSLPGWFKKLTGWHDD